MTSQAKQFIREEIAALSAYHVADPGDLIKLDAMENPYSLPDSLKQKWLSVLSDVALNRYPDPSAQQLVKKLRSFMEVDASQSIILGNGSDEIIQIIAMTLAKSGATILAPEPGFVMYKMIATFVGMNYIGVPVKSDFSLDMPAMLAAIKHHQPAVIFLAYPNNPTSNLFDEQDMIEIIKAAKGLVVVDEAYHPFACVSFMPRLSEFDNLVVMRTVSKMGLAGLRLGLLAGPDEWLAEFDKVRLPYNINALTQATANFVLDHDEVFEQQALSIREQRDSLFAQLKQIAELDVYPSKANFILFRLKSHDATSIFEKLKSSGVLIKNMHPAGGMMAQCLRVTVGAPEENKSFMAALINSLA